MGRSDAELAAWFARHRRGLQEPASAPQREPGRLRRWLRRAGQQATLTAAWWASKPTLRLPSRRVVRSGLAAGLLAADAAWSALTAQRATLTVANSTNAFGRAALDPAKPMGLPRPVRRVAFTNRADDDVLLIRSRRCGRPGWLDLDTGKWYPTISGGAGVDLFFRAAGTTWASTSSWSTTSGGGSAGVAPAATDRAIFEAASANCSIGASAVCRSLTCTAGTGTYAGTISGSGQLTLGDATAPTGATQLLIRGTWTHTGTVVFTNTGNSSKTFDANGNTLGGQIQFAFANGTIQMTGAATSGSAITKTGAGTLDTNGQALTSTTTMSFTSGTLTCGASVLTVNGTSLTCTPTTLNANTSEFVMTSAGTVTFTGTSKSFFKVTRTGTAAKTDALAIAGAYTLLSGGTTTFTGNSVTNRLLVQSSTLGTAVTITNSGATVTGSNVDFMDIALGTSTDLSAITGNSGDCGGNSNITFSPAVAQAATGTASFTWSTHGWTTRVPLPQDSVSIPNAFAPASRVITADMPRLGGAISCTCTGSPQWSSTVAASMFGSLTMATGMTTVNTGGLTLGGRSACTFTTNGVSNWTFSLVVAAPGGSVTLQDTWTTPRNATPLSVTSGTFSDNGNTVSFTQAANAQVLVNGGTLTMTGAWSFAGTSTQTFWNVTSGTVNATGSTITLTAVTANTRTFVGGGGTYGNLIYNVANSPGILSITGNNTWAGTWTIGPGRIVQCASGATQTFTGANGLGGVQGQNYGYLRLIGTTGVNASAPDIAGYTGAGVMRGAVRVALDDYTPAATQMLLAHSATAGSQAGWQFYVDTSAFLHFAASSTGSAFAVDQASSAPALVDGTTYWLGYDYNTGTGALTFYKAADQASPPTFWTGWTQVSTHSVTALTPFNSTAAMTIGDNGSSAATGNFYRTVFYTSTTTLQFDADFTTKAFGVNSFTETSSNAATVTINGALAQAGDGRVTLQAASGTTTLATGSGSTMAYVVPDHVLATPSGAVYALDSTDGGGNSGIVFNPPDQLPQVASMQGRSGAPIGNRAAVRRAGRW